MENAPDMINLCFFLFNFVATVLLMYSREDVSLANSVLSTKSLVEASADTIGNTPVQIPFILQYSTENIMFSTVIGADKDDKNAYTDHYMLCNSNQE
jgi:hypothetical protein